MTKDEEKDNYEIEIDHSKNISNFLKNFVNNKKNSDVIFKVGKETIFGHKIILSSRR
jgi:hypothetical protein